MKKYNDVQFVNNVKQPTFGSLVPTKLVFESTYEDDFKLPKKTKISSEIIDVAVNCLTKYLLSTNIKQAFRVPLLGAKIYAYNKTKNKEKYQEILNGLTLINGLNKQSIYVAINLAQFEGLFSKAPIFFKKVETIDVTDDVYDLVYALIKRNIRFFEEHGPVGKISFDFLDGKPENIANASLDLITRDAIWNLNSTKKFPDEQQRLLLVLHYVMFKHCPEGVSKDLKTLGIFDARANTSYTIETKDLPYKLLTKIEKLCGYEKSAFKDPKEKPKKEKKEK